MKKCARLRRPLWIALAACAVPAAGAMGQTAETATQGRPTAPAVEQAVEQGSRPSARASISADLEHMFEADFSDVNGSVSVTRAGLDFDAQFPLEDRQFFGISIGSAMYWFDFKDTVVGGTATELWDDAATIDVAVRYGASINDQWSFIVGVGVDSSFEHGAEFEDSLTYGGFGAANYKVSDTLSLGFGAIVRTRLDDDAFAIPIVSIDWQIAEQWRLSSRTRANSFGVSLAYQATEALELSLNGAYAARSFRLDDEGAAPEGVGRISGVPIFLEAAYKVDPQITIGGRVGAVVAASYKLDDVNEVEVFDEDSDIGIYAGLNVTVTF